MFYKDVTIGYNCRMDIVDIVIMSMFRNCVAGMGKLWFYVRILSRKAYTAHNTAYTLYSTEREQ